ncbi:ankyrin-2 ankyrin [Colletotrichum tamarilloi]|uniref:Ankyrin-2 ankyrin n=1 Tax=Colletotrichum tamarilloi TaxID=1209934 RepID=A0ABQ9R7P0_9PEZI|nr:ankyrin-2 ankyrin [Colletotrichum tamarilloi]KAK1497061.1 ankyrin-2 ankyrin [Colletotrichum tamarilloi]
MEADQLAVRLDDVRAIADATFRLTFSFTKNDGKLKSEIRAVANEIQDIAGLLHRLSLLASGLEETKDHDSDINAAPPPLVSCRTTLEQLGGSLRRRTNRSDDDGCEQKRYADVKWPFTRAWTTDLLNELSEHKKTISEGLNGESIKHLLQLLSKGKSVATIRDEDWISEVFTDFLQSSGYFQGIYMVLNTFLRAREDSYIKIQDRYKHFSIQSSFFQGEDFENWLDKGGSHLLFTAPPGGGRTAFTGALARETFRRRRARTVVVPIYFELLSGWTRWTTDMNILGTIVALIARQNQGAFEVLRRYRRDLNIQPRWATNGASMEGLKGVLWQMSTFFEHVLVIVDCSKSGGDGIIPMIASLLKTSKESAPNFSLAVVCQDLEFVRESLGESVTKCDIAPSMAILQAFAATEVERRVRTGALRFQRTAVKDATIRKLSVGDDHVFWKIAYQLDHLCSLQSHSEQVEFLEKLPCSLHDTYRLTLEEFQKRTPESRSLILRALQLTKCSRHKLSAQEFCQALSVSGISGLDPEMLEYPEVDESEILRQCSPMIIRSLDGNNQTYPWSTVGALALKTSEWARNSEIFAIVVRGGAQLHDDIIAVFRSICRKWTKHKDAGAKELIQDILEILNGMVEKKEGESLAYLKAFQKAVSETTDIDIPLPVSQGISDDMLVQQMWKSIDDDNLKAIEDQSQSNTRIKDLLKGDILMKLLDFAAACSAVNCLDHLLTNYMAENGSNDWKSKAVLYCVEDGKQEVLLCLLKDGAQTMRANARGSTIWHLAAAKATSTGILKILLENSDEEERKDALRMLNESGRTVLAKALVSKQYSNASIILKYCKKDRACLKSRHPSLPHLVAGIQDSVLLKELHDCEMFEFVAKDTPLNYFHIEDSAGVEATRQLLEIFPYPCSDQPPTPLRIYLSRSDLNIYKKELVALLVQKELSAAPIVNGIHTWQWFCKSVQGYFRRASEAEAWEVVELVKLMVHLGCMDDYEKARETSGLVEIVPLFDVDSMPRAFTPDNDAVLATEEIFGIVHDTTTLPQYYKSSGMDIKVIKWTIAHNSWHLFRRLIHTDIDVHKRDGRGNLLEYVCSHGTEFNGHRMLANLLERAEKDRLNELNPDGNLGLLHLLGMPYGKEDLSSDSSPLFSPSFIPMENFSQPQGSACPMRLGPGGFAALRIPRDNPKFSILQRLLDEHMDRQLLSKRGNFSALSTHIRYCYLDTARLLLLRGSPETLSTSDKFGWTPVAWACAHGYTDIIDQMAASSCSESIWDFQVEVALGVEAAPSFTKPYRGLCALHLAVLASAKTVSFLLNHGFASDLDITDAQLHTPLHFATMFGQLETIKELVSRGSNINAKDCDGWTPLHFAIHLEKKDTVELLLELSAAHMETKKGETPLDFAMPKEEYYIKRVQRSIQQNLKTGAEIHCDKQWLASLSRTMEKTIIDGDTKICRKILKEGCPVDIKMRSCHTCTALIFALSRNEVSANIVDTLVEHGASFRGTTCARHTCGNFKRYGIRHFSDYTSDNSSSSSSSSSSDSDDNKKYRQYAWPSFGSTSLDMLMWEDDLFEKISTWLCSVPEEDMIWLIDNSIAVHVAVDRGSLKALQVLLSHAAKIGDGLHRNLAYELVNRTGWHSGPYVASPLQDAVDACNLELVRLLLEYGAEVDKKTTAKGTALHQAANHESIELAQLLLEHGASLASRDYNRGFTPLEEAVQSGNTEMVNLFLDRGASASLFKR